MLDLLDQLLTRVAAGDRVIVCTVARTRGSTPQKAGATMLVLQGGQTIGTLGGGCVEAEVRVRSQRMSEPRLLTFRLDQDYGWDDGLVCGGVMDIAVQPVANATDAQPWQAARDTLIAGRSALLKLAVPTDAGEAFAFEQALDPVPTLFIAGAGHVGVSLAAIADQMGFAVTVIDDRPDYATAARFPRARLIVGGIEAELSRQEVHEHSYVVIVTRGHRNDGAALAAVVGSAARYIGLIGSKRKILTILADLRATGVPPEQIAKVHAPIGLDIGAVTPGEIAVSIAAELTAVRRGASTTNVQPMRLTAEQLKHLSR